MTDDSCRCSYIIDTDGFFTVGASGELTIPYGDTSFTELKDLYEEKLKAAGDCAGFILEDMELLADIRAAFFECREYQRPIYVTLSVGDDLKTGHELPADAALIVLQSLGADKFGVCAEEEETLIDAIKRLRPFSEIPLYVRPKSGTLSDEAVKELLTSGADGFCGLDAECRARVRRIVSEKDLAVREAEHFESLMLANERSAFFLENDTTEISAPLICSAGMSEELLEANESGCDVLKIVINSPDDALDFTDNAHMTTLPVMFSCDDDIVLKLALMLYQGRALIDSECMIEESELSDAAKKYGAIIY